MAISTILISIQHLLLQNKNVNILFHFNEYLASTKITALQISRLLDILFLRCFISYSEFFVFILTVIYSCFQGKETGPQSEGLSHPRENHAIVTSGSKGRVPTWSTGSVEQIYH